jgi:hydrogenase/urease accessory protein HupE
LALITFAAGLHAAVHWVEMAPDTAVVSYGLGMVLASALLYAAGYGIGSAIRPYAERVARVMGLTLAGSGLAWLLLG